MTMRSHGVADKANRAHHPATTERRVEHGQVRQLEYFHSEPQHVLIVRQNRLRT